MIWEKSNNAFGKYNGMVFQYNSQTKCQSLQWKRPAFETEKREYAKIRGQDHVYPLLMKLKKQNFSSKTKQSTKHYTLMFWNVYGQYICQ
jgi:hypothetical protein